MQKHHNTGAGKRASAPDKISRRSLISSLGTIVALSAVPAVASGSANLHTHAGCSQSTALEEASPLISMIREYNQIIERVEFLDSELGKLFRRADAVAYPVVWAHEVDSQMYGKVWSRRVGQLDSSDSIDEAFNDDSNWFWHSVEPHTTRHQANRATAKKLLLSRQEAREEWELASGYREIDVEVEQLNSRILELSDAIAKHPCECLADVRAKVDFIENNFGDNILPETAIAFFRSMLGQQGHNVSVDITIAQGGAV